jgi:hypothetical protein
MSQTEEPARGHERIHGSEDRERRYRLRPEPRGRMDFMGSSSALWMALGWIVVILAVAFPFPWFGW